MEMKITSTKTLTEEVSYMGLGSFEFRLIEKLTLDLRELALTRTNCHDPSLFEVEIDNSNLFCLLKLYCCVPIF